MISHFGTDSGAQQFSLPRSLIEARLFLSAWLKPKCRCCASLESEEEFESRLFVCRGCGHISLSQKGLRLHSLLVHKESRLFERTLDANGRPQLLWGTSCFATKTSLKAVED
ncbi:hypothetical protein CEXT_39541 [Caerostris extrusa]|uniref:C2H2-type domain-containing protein n=1 Tax=Caerostris extrusa TaxID=172846 RepID=A0AAV4UA96_CAEEX|nr:hypothetical protein CEXT_39541 [Caerostris extrusa]